MNQPKNIIDSILKRKSSNTYRQLSYNNLVDFCSNDYLGIAFNNLNKLDSNLNYKSGSTGSRLISGHNSTFESLENEIADFHKSESALIYNSGYDCNVGLFSSISSKNDTILYDSLIHASIRDGIKLSNSKSYKFEHNNLDHLEYLISKSKGNIFIAAESIYSMDGDRSDLNKLVEISKKNNAFLIIDEAHSTGIYGKNGSGLVQEMNLEKDVFIRVHTFGKALACHGAVVICDKIVKEFLINFSRSFIYTTALPEHSLLTIKKSYQLIKEMDNERLYLNKLINYFRSKFNSKEFSLTNSDSPIQSVIISDIEKTKNLALKLENNGFFVKPVLSPTVPFGTERLRICLHSHNTIIEIDKILKIICNE